MRSSVFATIIAIWSIQRTDLGQNIHIAAVPTAKVSRVVVPEPARALSAGVITAWRINTQNPGAVNFQLWRYGGSANQYQLLYQYPYLVTFCGFQTIVDGVFATVRKGDVIGFHSRPEVVLKSDNCTGPNSLFSSFAVISNTSSLHRDLLSFNEHIGSTYKFTQNATIGCRKYEMSPIIIYGGVLLGNKAKDRPNMDNKKNTIIIPAWYAGVKAGTVYAWQIYARRLGTMYLQILRKVTGLSYKIVYQTKLSITHLGLHTLQLSVLMHVNHGDVIGFYHPDNSLVPYHGSVCANQKTLYKESPASTNVKVGGTFTFTQIPSGSLPCRLYSISALFIKAPPCRIDLLSSGLDDPAPAADAFVKLNGQLQTATRRRGFNLVTITLDCIVGENKNFDTYASSTAWSAMGDYLKSLPPTTRVAGITYDSYKQRVAPVMPVLAVYGVDLTGSAFRSSLAFVAVIGQPANTVQQIKPRYKGPALLSKTLIA